MDNVAFTYLGDSATDTGSMNRISAIKAVRHLMSASLRDAKNLIDYIQDNPKTTKAMHTTKNFSGVPDAEIMECLDALEGQGVMVSINSSINDLRMQLVDIIKEASDADCFGLASDIALVCDKYFGFSPAYIRGNEK